MLFRSIEKNKYDHIFVLGVDIVSEFIVSGFNSFKSISPSICKPYDATRDGLTLGEGCATILLTSDKKLSENSIIISGGGVSDDANHISGPSRTGDGLEYAISSALNDAGLETSDISMMNLHGTGTLFNDEMESKAVNNLALTDVPCNSLKPYLGHTLGASGVIEIILTIEELKNNHIFGVKGYQNNGVPFELNINAHHRNSELKHCLKTASGFGGTNAAIIISKESVSVDKEKVQRHIDIEEITGITIEKSDIVFPEYIRHEYKALGETNMKFFKMDNLSKLGYIASCKLMSGISLNIPLNRIGIVMATRDSSLDTDLAHHEQLNKHLPEGTSPAIFVYTLANIVAAEIAIKQHFKGELMMFVSEHKNMNFLKEYSEQLIADNRCDAVLYGWCNFLKEEYCAELKLITTK